MVLNSIGTHLGRGSGPINGLTYLELKLNKLFDSEAVYLCPNRIGKSELSWVQFTDKQSLNGALQAGLSHTLAEGMYYYEIRHCK